MKNELTTDLINVGIGSFHKMEEVLNNTTGELKKAKTSLVESFNSFKERGEKDVTESSLSLKINVAWALVYFNDARDRISNYLTNIKK